MDTMTKLQILADSAKYDASCSSSGSSRASASFGAASNAGCCHSFAEDGRCISLLKVLFSNCCVNDCQYCQCRVSNDIPRATFEPRELADLCMDFYRRNYIEGLFLSSGVIKDADYTSEQLLKVLKILRHEYKFGGYIHTKAIPGTSSELVAQIGALTDRMSVNIELPSGKSLALFAPQKTKELITAPMAQIKQGIIERKDEIVVYKHAPDFVPAGQTTQMIVGASGESDLQILNLSEALYKKFSMKRVYFSAYVPIGTHPALPRDIDPPLLREHRLYQADWLMRFYGFSANEILDEENPHLDVALDPKCNWALRHLELFPIDVLRASYETLLRVPGVGVRSARRIVAARRGTRLRVEDLKKLGVVMKRAAYFITCGGKAAVPLDISYAYIYSCLTSGAPYMGEPHAMEQLSMFDKDFTPLPTREDKVKCLTGEI